MASDSEEIVYQSLDTAQYQRQARDNKRYRAHSNNNDADDDDGDDESEISLQEERGFLVHLSPEANKTQWNHVDDLDKFFAAVYDYHQRHGFQNMILAEVLQLLQFVFVVVFVIYLSWCVKYPELFDDIPHNTTRKKTFDDITYPFGTCVARFNFLTWFLLVLCFIFFLGRAIKMAVNFCHYVRTRNFFISALNIETKELSNMTWHEVQTRLLEVQKEHQICIHKQELTQLDIYHRILRFKNYMVAMVNKDVLPLKFKLPLLGQHALLTHGMRFNLDFILYWSPWSIFLNSYTLRQDYKVPHKRKQLADQLANHIAVLALLNLLLCPLIFLYQIIYFFFRYAEFVKRSPSFLGSRQWANYGRLYLRHFNELDHELNARLNRGYVSSKMYMNIFTSPSLIILAKYTAFFAGAPAAVLFFFGILDLNDVTKVEHLFTVASICGMVATISSSLIPDENEVHCPEQLLMTILTQIHYMPDHWKGHAHTSLVRDEFAALFQYKVVYLLEELFSPIVTPFWLLFCLRSRSHQMVDFFRCFTIEVAGVGDVCSFAQMDVKKHGNPMWKPDGKDENVPRSQQAEHGKTELSLMHFTTLNPEWRPPQESNAYITEIKHDVHREMPPSAAAAYSSMMMMPDPPNSLPSLGLVNPMDPALMNVSFQHLGQGGIGGGAMPLYNMSHSSYKLRGGLSNHDGPALPSTLPVCLSTSGSFHSANFAPNYMDEGQRELLAGNMSLSVLHIHDMHHRQKRTGHNSPRLSRVHTHHHQRGDDEEEEEVVTPSTIELETTANTAVPEQAPHPHPPPSSSSSNIGMYRGLPTSHFFPHQPRHHQQEQQKLRGLYIGSGSGVAAGGESLGDSSSTLLSSLSSSSSVLPNQAQGLGLGQQQQQQQSRPHQFSDFPSRRHPPKHYHQHHHQQQYPSSSSPSVQSTPTPPSSSAGGGTSVTDPHQALYWGGDLENEDYDDGAAVVSPFSNPFSQGVTPGLGHHHDSNIELSSLPPLETPGVITAFPGATTIRRTPPLAIAHSLNIGTLPPPPPPPSSSSSSPLSSSVPMATAATASSSSTKPSSCTDPALPRIKEDLGEHEIDTSLS